MHLAEAQSRGRQERLYADTVVSSHWDYMGMKDLITKGWSHPCSFLSKEIKQWLLLDLSSSQVSLVGKGPCCWQELGSFAFFFYLNFYKKLRQTFFHCQKCEKISSLGRSTKTRKSCQKVEIFHILYSDLIQSPFGGELLAKLLSEKWELARHMPGFRSPS